MPSEGPELTLSGDHGQPGYWRCRLAIALKQLAFQEIDFPGTVDGREGASPVTVMIGGHCFIGDLAGLIGLELAAPAPTLFPNGNRGMPLALGFWSNAAFEAHQRAAGYDPAHLALIARQLQDGRAFLQGPRPGLADIHSAAPLMALDTAANTLPAPVVGWLIRIQQLLSDSAKERSFTPLTSERLDEEGDILRRTASDSGQIVWESRLP